MEDELLDALEEEERQEAEKSGLKAPCHPPERPLAVARFKVPPEAVGDLLSVWDFLQVRGMSCPAACHADTGSVGE